MSWLDDVDVWIPPSPPTPTQPRQTRPLPSPGMDRGAQMAARRAGGDSLPGAPLAPPTEQVDYGIDPMQILQSLGWGQDSGGGGVRTIDNRPQVRDRYNAMRDQAEGRYGSSRADMGQLYDQLASAYQGLPEQAARRFEVASEGATGQTERLMQETAARVNEEAAARAAQAAELGIDPSPMEDLTETVDYQTGEMGRTGANWSGLMGALSTSEQTRGQLAYEGALDTGVMAKQDLLSRYTDYLEMLDANESQELMGAIQQVATGSGRSASNLPAGIVESLMMESFYQNGIIERPGSGEPGIMDYDSRLEQAAIEYGVTPNDILSLEQAIANGWNLQMYLQQGGNNRAIEAAKSLGITIPPKFLEPSILVPPPGSSNN